MLNIHFLRQTLLHYALLIAGACFLGPALNDSLRGQTPTTEEPIVITGEEVPSAYGAPPGLSRSRFSNTVNAYVLPPWSFFFGELFEGVGFRHGPPDYLFTQEVEMGLPYRFNIAAESQFERFNGGGGAQTVSLEARWALADWNKIPLNPTIFAEYKFGVGTIRHEEVPPPPGGEEEEESGPPTIPDAYEVRLLLAQDFFERVEWAMNWLFEKENTGDRGREWGFSQAAMIPVLLPAERLKVGVEMQYRNLTVKDTRGDPLNSFVIGPTVGWKPTAQTRLDISPLFGCTHDSPVADVFVAFSWLFGGERAEAEAPVSTRFRYLSMVPADSDFCSPKNQSRSHHRLCFRNAYAALSDSLHTSCALRLGWCGRDLRRWRKGYRSHTGTAGCLRCPCGDGSLRCRDQSSRPIRSRSRIPNRAALRLD